MFYEFRRYHARPGRREDLIEYMTAVVIPFMTTKGMDITASFTDEQDPHSFVWMRRFEDETQRQHLYAAVYDSVEWQTVIAPPADQMMLRDLAVITRLVPTSGSPLG